MAKSIHPSLFISKVLRHNPALAHLTLDTAGWADAEELFLAIQSRKPSYSREQFEAEIVTNERYSFSDESHSKVRADYGHSVGLKLEDLCGSADVPPPLLYHGTERQVKESILEGGILRQKRDHVFLTDSGEIALKKAMRRHTPPAVIIVDAKKMAEDGYAFYHPKANIWLTYEVPKEYILEAKDWI